MVLNEYYGTNDKKNCELRTRKYWSLFFSPKTAQNGTGFGLAGHRGICINLAVEAKTSFFLLAELL